MFTKSKAISVINQVINFTIILFFINSISKFVWLCINTAGFNTYTLLMPTIDNHKTAQNIINMAPFGIEAEKQSVETKEDISLTFVGSYISPKENFALIQDASTTKLMQVGNEINNMTLTKISATEVVLQDGDKKTVLELKAGIPADDTEEDTYQNKYYNKNHSNTSSGGQMQHKIFNSNLMRENSL